MLDHLWEIAAALAFCLFVAALAVWILALLFTIFGWPVLTVS
jgi:hypothetical protein